MGRIVFSIAVTADAEWELDGATFTYFLTTTGNSVSLQITAPEAYAGTYTTTVTALGNGPVNVISPEPRGPTSVGYDLSMFDGVWLSLDSSDLTFSRRFLNEGVQVGTGTTYTTQSSDAGDTMTVGVTATDSNGTSAEAVSTATIEMRATPWVQPNYAFNGTSTVLELDELLFQIVGETVDENESAKLFVVFASGTTDTVASTQQVFSHSNNASGVVLNTAPDVRSLANGAGLSDEALEEDAYGSVTRQSSDVLTVGERFSVLHIGRPDPDTPGSVAFVQAVLFEGATEWEVSPIGTTAGDTIWTAGAQGISIGARADGARFFDGTLSRVAVWCNADLPFNLYSHAGSVATIPADVLSKFMLDDTTLTPPDVAQAAYGTPVLDFNLSTHFSTGAHEGSLPSFTVTA